MKPALEIKNLSFTYPGRPVPSLQGINLTIEEGEFVLICGPTGCGKSTLLSCINGLIPHESGGLLEGSVFLFGQNVALSRPGDLFPQVATVFQNPSTQIVSGTLADEVAFGLENLGLPGRTIRARVEEALRLAGLWEKRDSPPEALSGGQRQRLAIVAALAVRPRLLLLDEPVSQLDPLATKEVLSLIREIVSRGDLTVIMVEHRLDEVLPLVSRIVEMDSGRIIYNGPVSERKDSFTFSGDPFEALKLRCSPLSPPSGSPVLRLKDISFTYSGGPRILNGVNLTFYQGERVAILGPNGSGKSTLLHLLAGLKRPSGGQIENFLPRRKGCLPIALLLQDPDLMLFRFRVSSELAFAPEFLGLPAKQVKLRVEKALETFSLEAFKDDPPFSLSRGQRLRTALASLVTGAPQILLLDEPTTGQDRLQVERLMENLSNLANLLIFTTHDLDLAHRFATRRVVFKFGKVADEF